MELNPLTQDHKDEFHTQQLEMVPWTEPGLKIERLRLLTYPGYPYLDVSYGHGRLNGKPVRVQVPFRDLPRKWKWALVEPAKRDDIHAKSMGLLDNVSILY